MKEAVQIICSCAARQRATALLQRSKAAQAVLRSGWRRLVGKLERIAAEAFVDMRCMMFNDSDPRNMWFPGQLTVDSLKQSLDFVSSGSAADNRTRSVGICLSDAPSIGLMCMAVNETDVGHRGSFDVRVDLFHSSLIFRFQSFQDALDLHICLLSYLLFRTMMNHHNSLHASPHDPNGRSAAAGRLYAKTRSNLLRSINLFLAYKSSVRPTSASKFLPPFASASAAGTGVSKILGRILGNRKVESLASQLVSRSLSKYQVTFCKSRVSGGIAPRFMGWHQRATEVSSNVRSKFLIRHTSHVTRHTSHAGLPIPNIGSTVYAGLPMPSIGSTVYRRHLLYRHHHRAWPARHIDLHASHFKRHSHNAALPVNNIGSCPLEQGFSASMCLPSSPIILPSNLSSMR
jgi:hypothetical protein